MDVAGGSNGFGCGCCLGRSRARRLLCHLFFGTAYSRCFGITLRTISDFTAEWSASRKLIGVRGPFFSVYCVVCADDGGLGMLTDLLGIIVKANNAQLVPAYAYDQRLPHVVYIRDKESDKGSGYMGASQGNARPSGIYQFSTLKGTVCH